MAIWGMVALGMWLFRKKLGKGVKKLYRKVFFFNVIWGALCWAVISMITSPKDAKMLIISVFVGVAVGVMTMLALYSPEEM